MKNKGTSALFLGDKSTDSPLQKSRQPMSDMKKANSKTRKQNYLTSKIQGLLMPIVDVKMWKGLSVDAAEQIISGITKVFVELGIPERAVEVVIHEIPKTHWGIGGKPASRVMADEKPP